MKHGALTILAALAAAWSGATLGQESPGRSDWEQKKAVEKVRRALELEKTGQKPWEKIAWVANPDEAVRRAQREGKPILVFLFKKIRQEWDGPEKWGRC